MRIDRITIYNFKNLNHFTIDFNEEFSRTVILGRNGTGKSNLLEALVIIFRDLDLGRPSLFRYELTYFCRGHQVYVDADPERSKNKVIVVVDGAKISYQQFAKHSDRRYLPNYVFGYYSGPGNRMEAHFEEHQERFYKDLLANKPSPLRPLLYARPVHSQFVLLSFFTEHDERILNFLNEYLGIERMDSVLFVLRQPPWYKKSSEGGDPRFWHARGAVADFLNKLYEVALAPLRLSQRINMDFRQSKTLEHLYLYLPDVKALKELYSLYESQQEFFKALESTYISKILSEVRIRVKVRNTDGSLTFRDLSEGEQQLLMVLGLLRFTKEDEALFLLDEPDTHLNPIWGIQYLDFIDQIVDARKTSQVVMVTHNPLVISRLERQQVRIMERNDDTGEITAEIPYERPRGMGVASILTSDLFGLRSSLDLPTQRLMDQRRELAAQETLSEEERAELTRLNRQLKDIDFSISTVQDPLYHDFVLEMTRREDPAIRGSVTLTREQRERQRELTRQILQELKAKREYSE